MNHDRKATDRPRLCVRCGEPVIEDSRHCQVHAIGPCYERILQFTAIGPKATDVCALSFKKWLPLLRKRLAE